jgi:ribosomal subunit interface protein
MEIDIRCNGMDLMEALRAYLQRRMRFRFDRHPELIRKITVRLTKQNTSKSHGGKLCQINAELNPAGEILVRETAADLYQAIGGGIERLGSALNGLRGRQRTAERGFESIRKENPPKKSSTKGGRRNSRVRRPLFERGRAEKLNAFAHER